MQKVDPAFLFELGDAARNVKRVSEASQPFEAYIDLVGARDAIRDAAFQSVYSSFFHDPLLNAAKALIEQINNALTYMIPEDGDARHLNRWHVLNIQNLYSKFETIFISEIQSLAVYMVTRKGGFDVDCMVDAGALFFSQGLHLKVPDAISDAEQAMRCIAFEVPTAAGFHLHRANESVLRVYWDSVTGGEPRPKNGNMGVYLDKLNALDKGKKAVREHLKSIKDFHRNPLMHPEQSLESVDEAIDLMAAIRCSIGYMLEEIPLPVSVSASPLPPPTS